METVNFTKGKAFSLFGKSGVMEEIKKVPVLPIGCKVYSFGMGMSETEGAIISEKNEFNQYRCVAISNFEPHFFTLDEYSRPISAKFGIGVYYDDCLEIISDEILEEYILKAEIANKTREQEKSNKEKADKEEKESLPGLYPHLTVNVTDNHTITKKNIVAELKFNFPNIKFSVRKEYYNSYYVSWTDGSTIDEVDSIVKKYEDHENDFTGDFRDPNPSNFNKVFGGFKYISTSRNFSDCREILLEKLSELLGDYSKSYPNEASDILYRIMRKTTFPYGSVPIGIVAKENFSGSMEDAFYLTFESTTTTTELKKKELPAVVKNESNLLVIDYSEKAIAVFGNTKEVKEILKSLGGRFNPKLKFEEETTAGWIFSKTKKEIVLNALNL